MTRPVGPPSLARQVSRIVTRVARLERRIVSSAGAQYEIKLVSDEDTFTTADEFIFEIPADLDGLQLLLVRAFVTTVGSSSTSVDVENLTGTVDMLTTNITIDSGEKSSRTAAAPAVIADPPDNVVADGDQIHVSVATAGTDAQGLGVILGFR